MQERVPFLCGKMERYYEKIEMEQEENRRSDRRRSCGAVIVVSAVNAGGTEGRYQETTVATRDIVSYLEFSGNIEAVDVSNVYAGVAAQIMEVNVEEGDQVEAGDVIAVLDSSEVEYNIAVQEATLNQAELTDSYNIKDSQTSLDNLNEQLDSGLNSTLNTAQETLLTAQQNYQDAVETYNQAKEELDNGTTQAVVSASRAWHRHRPPTIPQRISMKII